MVMNTDTRAVKLPSNLWYNEQFLQLAELNPHAFCVWLLALDYCAAHDTDTFTWFVAERFFQATQDDFQTLREFGLIGEADDKWRIRRFEPAVSEQTACHDNDGEAVEFKPWYDKVSAQSADGSDVFLD